MSQNNPIPVLIVGAGPTGLFMACELQRHGIDFRIIDKNPSASDKSKALGIHARSLEIFETAGIVKPFLEQGEIINGMIAYAGGKELLKISLEPMDSPYPYVISLPQSQTEALLIDRLAAAGKSVERNCELESFRQEEDRVIALVKNSNGKIEEIHSRYLLGCDGCHSQVRKELKLNFMGSPYDEMFVLADVSARGELQPNTIHVFNGPSGVLALFPYKGGRYRVVASLPDIKPDPGDGHGQDRTDLTTTLEEVQEIWNTRAHIPLVFSEPVWLTKFAIHHRLVPHYQVGRVFIGGDASHIHSPMGGQGMNTGLQDSHNLAWKLALVLKEKAPASILDSYEPERLAVAQKVVFMTDLLTKINTMKNPLAAHFRNAFAPLIASTGAVQSRLRNSLGELNLSYHNSPIVKEDLLSAAKSDILDQVEDNRPDLKEWLTFKHAPQAGDRAPDALFTKEQNTQAGQEAGRIFSLLKDTRHQLLLFSGSKPNEAAFDSLLAIAQYVDRELADIIRVHVVAATGIDTGRFASLPSLIIDKELNAHRKYGAASQCLYLLRPDGYIGYRSQPAELNTFFNYLKNIFTGINAVSIGEKISAAN